MRSAQRQRAALAAAVGFALFAAMAGLVATGRIEEEAALLRWLEDRRTASWTWAMVAITRLGSGPVTAAMVTALCLGLLARRQRREAVFLAAANLGGTALSATLKTIFERQRPPAEIVSSVTDPQSFSFPSGHAMSAMVFYASISIVGMRLGRAGLRAFVLGLALLMVPTMGFTRLYLGVHYPSDVVAGWALGAAWVSLTYLILYAKQSSAGRQGASRRG